MSQQLETLTRGFKIGYHYCSHFTKGAIHARSSALHIAHNLADVACVIPISPGWLQATAKSIQGKAILVSQYIMEMDQGSV